MTKSEFISKIKDLAKKAYARQTFQPEEPSPYPILDKFSSLKDIMDSLFDFQYQPFISDIQWVAPRPTTFRIILVNDGQFYLIYQTDVNNKGVYVAQIEGKKYFLQSLTDQQRASGAIARLLRYSKPEVSKESPPNDPNTGGATSPSKPSPPEEPELEAPPESPAT